MEPNIFDKIHDIDLKKTMETSYIDYAMRGMRFYFRISGSAKEF